jgi:hypothetical protein
MTMQLELHDVLPLTSEARLVYVGDGKCHSQKLRRNMLTGELFWKIDKQDQVLTEAQIARWLELKAQGKGSKL